MQRFYFKMQDGSKYEIDELDYNTLCGRIANGRYNGYYQVRGKINVGMRFAFKYFMTINAEGTPTPKDDLQPDRNIDIEKHKPQLVGKTEEKPKGCSHDWNKPEDWEYTKKNFDGKMQYRKRCLECGKVSPLIKPKEVELVMKSVDKTLNDVLDVS